MPRSVHCALGAMLLLVSSAPLAAQEAPATQASADRAATISAARRVLRERYVLPETGKRLDAALAVAERLGVFARLTGDALADTINAELRTITKDGHLGVRYDPAQAAALAARPAAEPAPDAPPSDRDLRDIQITNGGVQELRLLPGNIRYLDYRGFQWGAPGAEAALRTAMEFLRGGDALIIDIRRNGGGWPEAVAALTSYFLPPETKLARFEMRNDPGEASETSAAPFSLAGKPLYVLTSRASFSAAEEFATHVSAFGFGTLVGETTGGGGFRNEIVALPGGFVMSVSIGRPVHAVTGGDWEGVGVAPRIAVPADKALLRAQAEAMTTVAVKAPAGERRAAERIATYYRALETPVDPGLAAAAYAGRYGPRTLAVDAAGNLTVARAGRPPSRLIAVGPDTFVPEASPMQHFRFIREGGRVNAVDIDGQDLEPQRVARD